MHCTAMSIDEVMVWVDAMSATTGLLPSHVLDIYAELCRFKSAGHLIQEIAEREAILHRFDEQNNLPLMHAYCNTYIVMQDTQLRERDKQEFAERVEHYKAVLKHRGFDKFFVEDFLQHLSPTTDRMPEQFEMKGRRSFHKRFVDKPFYGHIEMKTKVPSPFEAMAKVYHMFKAGMPMSAAGWMAVMKHLGFVICKGSVNKTWKLGEPSFQVEDDRDPIPVFLCNEMGFPFIENPSIRKVEAQVGEYLAERQIRRGILFVGPPMRIADDEDAECLVFWGGSTATRCGYPWCSTRDPPPLRRSWKTPHSLEMELTGSIPSTLWTLTMAWYRYLPKTTLIRP